MSRAKANGLEFEYDTFGDRRATPLLLIMGLATQMIWWERGFCEALARRGHFVIRYDNRDVGKSSWLDDAPIPDVFKLFTGQTTTAPYSIADMADDAVGLVQALGFERAHFFGMSMGGMIAQSAAIRHRGCVASLTSMMSTTGQPGLPPPRPDIVELMLTPPPAEREAYISLMARFWSTFSGPQCMYDGPRVRALAGEAFDRGFYPQGGVRQLAALMTQPDRRPELGRLELRATVIHGSEDPLVPVEAGRETARAIPGARLVEIEGMGHSLPEVVWGTVIDAVSATTSVSG